MMIMENDGVWNDEVEDDDEDGSFELVVDPVFPRHVQPSSQTPSHGSNLEQHRGPALRSLRVAMEKRDTTENKVKGATEENQVKNTDEEDIQVAEERAIPWMDDKKTEAVNAETFAANNNGHRPYGGSPEGTGTRKKS